MRLLQHFADRRRLRPKIEASRPRLFRLAWSWCHDPQLADDLVQVTLLRALQGLDKLRDPERLEVWLTQILVNQHQDTLRRRRNDTTYEEGLFPAVGSPDQDLQRTDLIARVRTAVRQLGDEQRKVLTLVDLMEFSYVEVAQALDIPIGTVMSRLCRARRNLKRRIEQQSLEPIDGTRLRRVK
ncbi:MAG: sigma-70 family RNA polymerase sigma factor [Pseudomonadota bacterium]